MSFGVNAKVDNDTKGINVEADETLGFDLLATVTSPMYRHGSCSSRPSKDAELFTRRPQGCAHVLHDGPHSTQAMVNPSFGSPTLAARNHAACANPMTFRSNSASPGPATEELKPYSTPTQISSHSHTTPSASDPRPSSASSHAMGVLDNVNRNPTSSSSRTFDLVGRARLNSLDYTNLRTPNYAPQRRLSRRFSLQVSSPFSNRKANKQEGNLFALDLAEPRVKTANKNCFYLWHQLPEAVRIDIMSFLSERNVVHIGAVSKSMLRTTRADAVWRPIYFEKYVINFCTCYFCC